MIFLEKKAGEGGERGGFISVRKTDKFASWSLFWASHYLAAYAGAGNGLLEDLRIVQPLQVFPVPLNSLLHRQHRPSSMM